MRAQYSQYENESHIYKPEKRCGSGCKLPVTPANEARDLIISTEHWNFVCAVGKQISPMDYGDDLKEWVMAVQKESCDWKQRHWLSQCAHHRGKFNWHCMTVSVRRGISAVLDSSVPWISSMMSIKKQNADLFPIIWSVYCNTYCQDR